jgi:hypothetical protein
VRIDDGRVEIDVRGKQVRRRRKSEESERERERERELYAVENSN